LSLDTDSNHLILGHLIRLSVMENGMSHRTSNDDTSRARVKKNRRVVVISCKYYQRMRTQTES